MKFHENSQMVKSMLLLIMGGYITVDEVPDVLNLKEVVESILTK